MYAILKLKKPGEYKCGGGESKHGTKYTCITKSYTREYSNDLSVTKAVSDYTLAADVLSSMHNAKVSSFK